MGIGRALTLKLTSARFPPKLTLVSGQSQSIFGASDATCGSSDHSATGKLMTFAAFDNIFATVIAIRPGGAAAGCASYW